MNTSTPPPSTSGGRTSVSGSTQSDGASGRGRWPRTLGAGLLAGLAAGLILTVVIAGLRILIGAPLPTELGADRFLPTVNVATFLRLLSQNGGAVPAKEKAFNSGFAGQIALGIVLGVVYAVIVELDRRREPDRRWRFGVSRRGGLFVLAAFALIWIVSMALFWPALGANNRGLPPDQARFVTAISLLISYASYGLALVLMYRAMTSRVPLRQPAPIGPFAGRGAFIAGATGVVAALASGGLIRALFQRGTFSYDGMTFQSHTMPAVTPNDKFYVVTKNLIDPLTIDKATWRLEVNGLVDKPHTYGFDDISALPSVMQTTTLECISNGLGGGLISNADWKGVPLHKLIEAAGPKGGVTDVLLHCADGYKHDITFAKAMQSTTILAYEMNGVPLPDRHGYPARLLVPGYYGEGSAKWITQIELIDHNVERTDDYYGQQGWSSRDVHTWSRFDQPQGGSTIKLAGATTVMMHGTAFAGDRGISKVEVSADGERTWREATIVYHPSPTAWALWRYAWRPDKAGGHILSVRATDGKGQVQTTKRQSSAPSGATGYQRIGVHVQA